MFSFLLRRRASPPRPRTNAEKRLGTEDYSLKRKAKAFFKPDQWMSRIPHYFYSVNFIYASKKVLVCLIRDLQNQYHHMYNICWNVFCKTNLYVNRRHPGKPLGSQLGREKRRDESFQKLSSRPDWLPMGSEDDSMTILYTHVHICTILLF